MAKTYDLIVIGTGTAAQVASNRLAAAGWQVAVTDYRPFGGTCALRGCDPKKMLIAGAEVMDGIRRMTGRGILTHDPRIVWRALMAFKRTFTGPVPAKQEQSFKQKGIDAYHAAARFIAPNAIELDSGDRLEARYLLIATGARPVPLHFPGAQLLVTHEDFLELDDIPKRIVLVGGGYIASEFSSIAANAGAQVTVLQSGPRLLPEFDPDLVGWLLTSFRRAGIAVHTDHTVQAVSQNGSCFTVHARTKNGEQKFEADLVIHAAGRIPDLDPLNLAAGGIERDEHGHLKLNEFLQSVSNPAVYAAGDAAANGPPLTPVSSHDAKIVARNLLEGNHHRPNYRGVPSVAFTIPPIAKVGLSEEEARAQNLKFRIKGENTSDWYTARRIAESVYGYKVLIDESSDRILGAHLVGPNVDEVINLFAFAIQHGLTTEAVKATIFAYPTGASDISSML